MFNISKMDCFQVNLSLYFTSSFVNKIFVLMIFFSLTKELEIISKALQRMRFRVRESYIFGWRTAQSYFILFFFLIYYNCVDVLFVSQFSCETTVDFLQYFVYRFFDNTMTVKSIQHKMCLINRSHTIQLWNKKCS